jgi:hypothetical protein
MYVITTAFREANHQELGDALEKKERIVIFPFFKGDEFLPFKDSDKSESRYFSLKKQVAYNFYCHLMRKYNSHTISYCATEQDFLNQFSQNTNEASFLVNAKFEVAEIYWWQKFFPQANLLFYQNHLFKRQFLFQKIGFTSFRKNGELTFISQLNNYKEAVINISDLSTQEQEALTFIEEYFQSNKPSSYFETRNHFWVKDHSTQFSSFLSLGLISPNFIWRSVQRYQQTHGVEKSSSWIQFELLWRDYFYQLSHLMREKIFYIHPDKPPLLGLKKVFISSLEDSLMSDKIISKAWEQLKNTGELSNRMRQIFASFWCHQDHLDWRYGAYLFQYFLKDYDSSSNWGNWQYLAGVGVDPRGKRYFNLQKQQQTYDPENTYIKLTF